ncbi:ATP-binding protein [Cupriavidus taiwanensis]|uniref:ATP-binding protein n=1 Tax=Cupriavidus taiwanensis TaxID=164546 RepID=UPI000E203E0F|nr:ATP-binding protein [Cupriavidus taiwanensis]
MKNNIVSAAPTKKFFISVLVKDINLLDAIVELVDNSVDAARSRLGQDAIHNTVIEVDFSGNHFHIKDNAGGITIDQAQKNAFRFGRPANAPVTPGTVGEFGVGMKRALFKLGREFSIKSNTTNDNFSIKVDVDDWENGDDANPESWSFEFEETGNNATGHAAGTEITVNRLYPFAAQELASAAFHSRLSNTLRQAHAESLTRGLQIIVNRIPILAKEAYLLASEDLQPIFKAREIDIDGKIVSVRIIAGVSEPSLTDAGWYIYCNGRQIERAEKTEKTGWNTELDGGERTPKPHWQFRRFRGYVYFDSAAHDVLPWNTTKTSLDTETAVYRRVFSEITSTLRQVIGFLNSLDNENNEPGQLTALIDDAKPKRVAELSANESFIANAVPRPQSPKPVRISYVRSADHVNLIKEALGATSNREVGEKTFEYFMQNEGLDG